MEHNNKQLFGEYFYNIALCIHKISNKLPNDIIIHYLWPMLSFPHQGRSEFSLSQVNLKNSCVQELPRRRSSYGPQIIYNFARRKPLPIPVQHSVQHSESHSFVKFIYSIHHSKKFPNRYINILEHFIIDRERTENNIKKNICDNIKTPWCGIKTIYDGGGGGAGNGGGGGGEYALEYAACKATRGVFNGESNVLNEKNKFNEFTHLLRKWYDFELV